MRDFWMTVAFYILNIALPYLITRHDRRRLTPEQLARAWNAASWASAVFFFGPLCLPAHFWVTRGTVLGALRGVLSAAAVLGCEWVIGSGWEAATGG